MHVFGGRLVSPMERRGSWSMTLLIIIIIIIIPPLVASELSSHCPKCEPGFVPQGCKCVRCPKNMYWLMRQGHALCERCTTVCSAQRHLVEVSACTSTSNRECHCRAGFFCASAAQYTCRRCKPCPEGTFSNVTSRSGSCQSYTDCTALGMAVIAKGSRTHDEVCGLVMSRLLNNPRL